MFIVLNDQGGNRMDITEDITTTLRAEDHHPPLVLSLWTIRLFLWIQTATGIGCERTRLGKRSLSVAHSRNKPRCADCL